MVTEKRVMEPLAGGCSEHSTIWHGNVDTTTVAVAVAAAATVVPSEYNSCNSVQPCWASIEEERMTALNMLVAVYSSAVDAHLVAKQLLGSVIQECRLNTETLVGGKLLQSPA